MGGGHGFYSGVPQVIPDPFQKKNLLWQFFPNQTCIIPGLEKTWFFFLGFLPARATELLNQGKALIALVYIRPWYQPWFASPLPPAAFIAGTSEATLCSFLLFFFIQSIPVSQRHKLRRTNCAKPIMSYSAGCNCIKGPFTRIVYSVIIYSTRLFNWIWCA